MSKIKYKNEDVEKKGQRRPMMNGNPIKSQQVEPTGQGTAAGFVPAQFPLGLKIGFWVCIAIAIAVVLRRVVALSTPPSPNAPAQLAALDSYFAAYAALTYVHIPFPPGFLVPLPLPLFGPPSPASSGAAPAPQSRSSASSSR